MLDLFSKKCECCESELNGFFLEAKVRVYGRVDKWKRKFCSENCLEEYNLRTEKMLIENFRCMPCSV